MNERATAIGRAKTVLVSQAGSQSRAAVATATAKARRRSGRKRLIFRGPVSFEDDVVRHLNDTVLVVIDRITEALGIRPKAYELSVANLSASAAADLGLTVSGFSADAALMLAMLSAALRLPISQQVVVSAHVASSDGDLRLVRSIPAKLEAAVRDPSIHRFVCPSLDSDGSLLMFSPAERQRIVDAFVAAAIDIRVVEAREIGELVAAATHDDAIALASLRSGFFELDRQPDADGGPMDRVARYLSERNEQRFWSALESRLLGGQGPQARQLLAARVSHEIRQKRYPVGLGGRLHRLLCSLPPATRRLKTAFPLLEMAKCLQLCRFAQPAEQTDVQAFLDAVAGRHLGRRKAQTADSSENAPLRDGSVDAVEAVLAEIGSAALAERIGLAADEARAAYVMEEVTVESHEEFLDIISAFYLALLRRTGTTSTDLDQDSIAAEALALMERAVAHRGKLEGAYAEARDGTGGGMRTLLDLMTERFKEEQQAKHVARIFKEAMDPLDWEARVGFMRSFLQRIGPQLPKDIRNAPAERFAGRYEMIVETYIKSLDQFKRALRAL